METLSRRILELFASAIAEKIFYRAVAGYVLPDGKTQVFAFGIGEDAVFDIASLTKVCPTSALALKAILEEKLSLDTPVIRWIPEIQSNFREQILVRHLLTHSLDYRVPMSSLKSLSPHAILETLYTYPFLKAPGSVFNYGNPASILLGILLSRLYREPLSDLGRKFFFKTLGMARSGWFPFARVPVNEVIPTENCPWRGRVIHGEVHDESAFVLGSLFPVGSAGMFSSVPDLLKFLRMVLQDGVSGGQRLMPPGLLSMVSAPALENVPGAACSFGFEYNAERFMGNCKGKKRFGKTGFTGASMVADAELSAGIVVLSDFTYPLRERNADRINTFRRNLSELFFDSVSACG